MAQLPILEVADRWFANLNASVNSAVTEWVLKSSGATGLPARTIIHCDAEKVLVTGIAVDTPSAGLDTLTVERGYGGTMAASHLANAQCAHLNYREFHNELYERLARLERFVAAYVGGDGVAQDGGLMVQATGTPSMAVEITAGGAIVAGQPTARRTLATLSFEAPVGNPRIDIVQISQTGEITAKAGTPAGPPTAPSVDTDHALLAEVELADGATEIENGDITMVATYL